MTNSQLHNILVEIGEEIVPEETDLWPNIQHRLKTGKKFPSQTCKLVLPILDGLLPIPLFNSFNSLAQIFFPRLLL